MVLGGVLIVGGIAEVLLLADLGGLWFALLGWFLTSAARAETTDTTLRSSLAGVRVGDVMTAPAVSGVTSQSVADFVTTVVRHRPHRAFPVLDLDGRVAGLVSLVRLARVPAADRDRVRLGEVMAPLDQITVLDPATPLVDAAGALAASRLALVVTDGRLRGVLSASDIASGLEVASLGATPDRGGGPVLARPSGLGSTA
jgi:CBS domain-containing protein